METQTEQPKELMKKPSSMSGIEFDKIDALRSGRRVLTSYIKEWTKGKMTQRDEAILRMLICQVEQQHQNRVHRLRDERNVEVAK